jgi:hypothetical protein
MHCSHCGWFTNITEWIGILFYALEEMGEAVEIIPLLE